MTSAFTSSDGSSSASGGGGAIIEGMRGAAGIVKSSGAGDGAIAGIRSATAYIIASGGADTVADIVKAVKVGGASAAAAGSMFVFHGRNRAVLITYLSEEELRMVSC